MNEWLRELLSRPRNRGILVDTNILLLFFVGSFDRSLIPRFVRTSRFQGEDFDLLSYLLSRFAKIVTTPHILAEVSNLSDKLEMPLRADYFQKFAGLIEVMKESHLPVRKVVRVEPFSKLGVTDSAIFHFSRKYLVLTDDFLLSQSITSAGGDSINFNHLRGPRLLE